MRNGHRCNAQILLERVADCSREDGVSRLLDLAAAEPLHSEMWIIAMYMAASSSDNADTIHSFLDGLEAFMNTTQASQCEAYDFDQIGEVQFLRDRLSQLGVDGKREG